MTEPVEPEPRAFQQNPYAAPQNDAPGTDLHSAVTITFDELKAYVGPKHLFYWAAWRRAAGKGLIFAGFNWAAGFFNVIWLLHRKMYVEFAWALGLVIGVSALESLVLAPLLAETEALANATNVALFAVGGFFGNGLYLHRVRRVVAEVRQNEPDPIRRNQLLALRGGRAWLWPIVASFISVGLVVLAATGGTPP